MKKILEFFVKLFGLNLTKILCSTSDAMKSFFQYKKTNIQNEIEKKKQKSEEELCKKIDKVTKNGTLDDLLDLKRKFK